MTEGEISSSDLAQRIVDILSDRQAEDVVLLDIARVASLPTTS
jgi:ribosomal silencing factor RsfS